MDADEIFEKKFKDEILDVLSKTKAEVVCFRLYDFWDDNHYREDNYWLAHKYYRAFLFRYKPQSHYKWNEKPLHCSRLPLTVYEFVCEPSELRLKHYGWKKKEDRLLKYERYMKLDPLKIYGLKEQYESILDELPKLKQWYE